MTTLYTGMEPPCGDYLHTPLIDIVPLADDAGLRQAAVRACSYDYVLFTSRYAVRAFVPLLPSREALTEHARVVSIGATTTRTLKEAGIDRVEQVEADNSYGVISWFSHQTVGRVLIPRSDIALPIIPDGLRKLGFEADGVTAYLNRMPEHAQKVDLRQVERIVFTSPSTVDNFVRLYGALPKDKVLDTRGTVTLQRLKQYLNKQQ